MELKCAFVLVLVNLVAAHGYAVKGAGAVAKAESSATAASGIGEVPVSVPTGGGFSSSFSKSSSSSYASSSASSSSSSFSYSSAGSGGLTGTNSIPLSGKGDCVSGACQDHFNGEINGSDTALNGLKAYAGSASGANAFATSAGYLQNTGQIPCAGNECSNQGLTEVKSSSISGSLAHAQSGGQSPCSRENCANQNSPTSGAKTNSVSESSGYSPSSNKYPCTGENCSKKSNCASGTCGSQLQTSPPSYEYGLQNTLLNSNDENSKYEDSSIATLNSKIDNVDGSKGVFNNIKQEQSSDIFHNTDQSKSHEQGSNGYESTPACIHGQCHSSPPYSQSKGTETLNPLSSYSTQSPGCISGNCGYGFTKAQYPNSGQGGAVVAIPSTVLTVPKETNNPESPCIAPGCQTPGENNYSNHLNRPSSYNVPLYSVETTGPTLSPQEKDVTCLSGNCKNNYPHTDYSPNHSNSMTPVFHPVPFNTNKDNNIEDTKDIEVIKSPSTSYNKLHIPSVPATTSTCSSGNCANTFVDKPQDSKLPSYLATLPSQPYNPISTTYNSGTPNCGAGNCISYPSSFVNPGTETGNSNLIPLLSPQTVPILNCLGLNCAPRPSYQIKEPLPNMKPNYSFTTPSLSTSHSSIQPPKYSNTPYPIYQVPIVSSKNPSYTHGNSQQSYHNQLPISGLAQTGTTSLPSASSSQTHSIIGSNQKGSVYTGGFGGPTGLLTPNDYTVPAKPLSPEQRPPVKPLYPYDGSLAPTSTTVNYPADHKVTCANGNCGNHPSVSHYGQGTLTSIASTNSETESKGVLYTGGFGGPSGVLAPNDGNTNFTPSGVSAKPATTGSYHNGPHTGNIYSSYNSFPNTPSKPHIDTTGTSAESNAFNNGYKKQDHIGHSFGDSTALKKDNASHGDNSHFEFGNAFGLFMSSQPNSFSSSQPNTLNGYSGSGSGSQTIKGSPNDAAASAGALAYSGSKSQENGKINKYPSPCGNGDCSSHYGGSNSGLGFLNSEGSSSVGAGAIASAQSGAFSGFFENHEGNTSQPKEGCAGGCASNGVNSDGGNRLYGTGAIAKSSASATSGVGTDQFGLGRSYATSIASAHASSGAAVKGSYGKR